MLAQITDNHNKHQMVALIPLTPKQQNTEDMEIKDDQQMEIKIYQSKGGMQSILAAN